MTWFSGVTASYDSNFRCKRKLHGYLFLACALLLIAVPANARPKETGDVIIPLDDAGLALSEEYGDVDNIEFHQAKIVDGVLQEEHPVIMYKEDFVSEDFVPKKNNTHRLRKHKDPAHRRRRINDQSNSNSEQYHPLQPEKIYFDILSSAPIVTSDESKSANAKTHVEVISLADADAKLVDGEDDAKRVLSKRPKKFQHRRQRRDADRIWHMEHIVQKRHQNPYYRTSNSNAIRAHPQVSNHYLPSYETAKRYQKYPIAGEYYNGLGNSVPQRKITVVSRFGGEENTDRVIWRDYTPTRNPNQRLNITVGTPRPLFGARRPPTPTEAPLSAVPAPRDQGAASFDSRPISDPVVTEAPIFKVPTPPTPTSAPASTACVWAIASCCAPNDSAVRYGCFQRYGCNLVFWNLNPCADNIRDNVIDFLSKQYD
ncbi:uncharacterized protein LOC105209187 isoform X1 [Zeugodacus cucurbitae]|uniref:uncharacterized protein LOC105209187 isoform X1 n=1 Tax=Zeugodacus cucurbitae TaxID=28588 RepID=UPI0023D920BA|nr:uncharacterized protein LOC105209187 isoform X1 [Zeugodacus cucurbitae]XP_028894127.2 uncharacterized protein LOC105209187 isoform X1 [Zeugodacus cucurbitae]XP_054084970.1 uncharacterized protein LOC105209187 isoform X1 [Zeugodacus cucurbitae]